MYRFLAPERPLLLLDSPALGSLAIPPICRTTAIDYPIKYEMASVHTSMDFLNADPLLNLLINCIGGN